MPVFISHRTQDNDKAKLLSMHLDHRGVPSYLDDFDPRLDETSEITALLVDAINRCTHLMALVTDNTRESWWVPFEVGVARQAPRRISTFRSGPEQLPEYLTEWPVLSKFADLDQFAAMYHRDIETRPLYEKRAYDTILTPDDFHRQLKAALGQP